MSIEAPKLFSVFIQNRVSHGLCGSMYEGAELFLRDGYRKTVYRNNGLYQRHYVHGSTSIEPPKMGGLSAYESGTDAQLMRCDV